jgi:hypothetical protein
MDNNGSDEKETFTINIGNYFGKVEKPITISIECSSEFTAPNWKRNNLINEIYLYGIFPCSVSDGQEIKYEVNSLPTGLTYNEETRIISGIPTDITSGSISITPYALDKNGNKVYSETTFYLYYNILSDAPTLSVNLTTTSVQHWQATVAIGSIDLMSMCGISTSDGSTPKFTSSNVPAGLTLSSSGIVSGTPESIGMGAFRVAVCIPGFEAETTKYISVNYNISAAPVQPVVTANDVILDEMTVGQSVEINIAELSNASENTGRPLAFSASGVPEGLSMNVKNGFLIGTPTTEASGNFSVHIYVVSDPTISKDISVSYNIKAASVPFQSLTKINPTSNPTSAIVGEPITLELGILPAECTDDVSVTWDPSCEYFEITPNGLTATVKFLQECDVDVYAYPSVNGGKPSMDNRMGWFIQAKQATIEDKTYLYKVTGAGTEAVNGNYYDTGIVHDDNPVYVNDNNIMLWRFSDANRWVFSNKNDYTESTNNWYYYMESSSFVGDWNTTNMSDTCTLGTSPKPVISNFN